MTQTTTTQTLACVPTQASQLLVLPLQPPERTSNTEGRGHVSLSLPEDKPGLLLAMRVPQRAQTLPWGVYTDSYSRNSFPAEGSCAHASWAKEWSWPV